MGGSGDLANNPSGPDTESRSAYLESGARDDLRVLYELIGMSYLMQLYAFLRYNTMSIVPGI